MQIDKIQAKIRPRSNWEAVDLGFLMANKWKKNIYKIWFFITLPFFLLLNILFHGDMIWAVILFWFFIPIYDRFILLAISRQLFDEKISLIEVIRVAPRLTFKHIVKHLTFYRFDPSRSFNLPVWFLEKLSGSKRTARARVLKLTASGTASTLTTASSVLIVFFYISILGTITSFIPGYKLFGNIFRDSIDNIISLYQSHVWYVELIANFIFYISVTLVEPFYVCAGFALYLNRRTELESWDIELSFKSLRNRLEEKHIKFEMAGVSKNVIKSFLLIAFCSILVTTPISKSFAEEQSTPEQHYSSMEQPDNKESRQNIENGTNISSNQDAGSHTQDQSGQCTKKDSSLSNDYTDSQRDEIIENGVRRSFECIDWEEKLNSEPKNIVEAELRDLLKQEKYKKCFVVTRFERIPSKDKDGFWKRFWEYIFDSDNTNSGDSDSDSINIANIFEVIIWCFIAAGIIYLLIQLYRYREGLIEFFSPSNVNDDEIPTEIFGLDITPESIPDLLSDEVLKLWEQGQKLQALSLLYRGYLSKLIHTFGADIKMSFTENDCLNAAKNTIKHRKNIIILFSEITNYWLMAAYAHRLPSDDNVIECCRLWRANFESEINKMEVGIEKVI